MKNKITLSVFAFFGGVVCIFAQQSILAVNSGEKVVIQLNINDGSIINKNFINVSGLSPGRIRAITQVGDKIWITDQNSGVIYIYSLSGNHETTITGGINNIRGLNVVNNEVWVTNEGNKNGAIPNSIVRYTKAGVKIGNYPTINNPFDVLDIGGGNALVSSFTSNGIAKLSYDGITTSAFVAPNIINNPQQLNINSSGNIIVAIFISVGTETGGIYEFSPAGVLLKKHPILTGTVHGVIEAGNGNYLVSTSKGIYSLDPISGISTQIITGEFQFFTKVDSSLAVSEGLANSISFFPNPVKDMLNISNQSEINNVMVYSMSGQLQMQQKVNAKSAQVNLSKLSHGTYIVKIIDQSLKTQTIKVIKK